MKRQHIELTLGARREHENVEKEPTDSGTNQHWKKRPHLALCVLLPNDFLILASISEMRYRKKQGNLLEQNYVRRVDKFLDELIWMSRVLCHGRENIPSV